MATAGCGCAGSLTSRAVGHRRQRRRASPVLVARRPLDRVLRRQGKLKRIAEAGGLPQDHLRRAIDAQSSGTWSRDGHDPVRRASDTRSAAWHETGGCARRPRRPSMHRAARTGIRGPYSCRTGGVSCFLAQSNDPAQTAVYQGTLGSTETTPGVRRRIPRRGVAGRACLLTLSKGLLIAQAYDAERAQVSGPSLRQSPSDVGTRMPPQRSGRRPVGGRGRRGGLQERERSTAA